MGRGAVIAAFHCDRAGRGADEIAEVAADTFLFDNVWISLAVDLLKVKALMCTVLAGDIAKVTPYAVLGIDVGLDRVVKVEVSPVGHSAG